MPRPSPSVSAHPLLAYRLGNYSEGRRSNHDVTGYPAAAGVLRGDANAGDSAISQTTGLNQTRGLVVQTKGVTWSAMSAKQKPPEGGLNVPMLIFFIREYDIRFPLP